MSTTEFRRMSWACACTMVRVQDPQRTELLGLLAGNLRAMCSDRDWRGMIMALMPKAQAMLDEAKRKAAAAAPVPAPAVP